MSTITGIVRCDTCKHEIPDQTVANWHGESCPKCGAPDIVDDADMRIIAKMQMLIDAGLCAQGVDTGITIEFDSAVIKSTVTDPT